MIRTSDGQLYTGITTDIQRRWQEHLSGKGGARYFRGRPPQSLCLLEEHLDRSSASKREAEIKKYSKPRKEALVAQHSGLLVEGKLLDEKLLDTKLTNNKRMGEKLMVSTLA